VLSLLLEPKPFSIVMSGLPFNSVMDFIEDHIINNSVVDEDIKLRLLNSDDILAYSFIGAFIHNVMLIGLVDD
jgi:hypothetical protein